MNAKRKPSKGHFRNSIIKNILLIVTLGVVVLVATLVLLHIYTRQNKSVNVPLLKGLQLKEAKVLLKSKGLNFVVNDSIYDRDAIPGAIIEQVPTANSTTKEGRKVLLTIYSNNPPKIAVPGLTDYSLRQAEALLISMGFEQLSIEEVPSEHDDLVNAIEYRGRKLQPEEKIPAGSPLTIIVGSTSLQELQDIDSEYNSSDNEDKQPTEPRQESETNSPIVDESFF
ncbi:MAG: PASTA domain-containing protein [Bacteroidales bacterium]|nr:PASTA domain-containing protein [Bacteroidales bacterium]